MRLCAADDLSPDLKTYHETIARSLQTYCVECHGEKRQKGDVRLDTIDGDLVNGKSVSLWKDALHRVETHEMPPEDEPQPSDAERERFAQWIRDELAQAPNRATRRAGPRRDSQAEPKRVPQHDSGFVRAALRRTAISPDTTYHGFDHAASVQELSRSQMETYLELARFAIDKAIVTGERPMTFSYRAEPELGKAGLEWRVNSAENLEAAKKFAAEYRVGRRDENEGGPVEPNLSL